MQRNDILLYERVLERMLAAGWIENYQFSGGGLEIQWTKGGRRRAHFLRKLIKGFQLNNQAQAVRFDVLCANSLRAYPHPGEVSADIAQVWRDSLDELHLTSDEIDFMCMVHGLMEFGPDDDGSGSNRGRSSKPERSPSQNQGRGIGHAV